MNSTKEMYGQINSVDDLKIKLQEPNFFIDYITFLQEFIKSSFQADEDDENAVAYNPNQATIVGLMCRIIKYYGEIIFYYKEKKAEMIFLMFRTIYESFVTMKYLIEHGEKSQRHFRLISYKNRYKEIEKLENTNSPICKILAEKFKYQIKRDGFLLSDFQEENKDKRKRWKLDGKTFKNIQNEVDIKEAYNYVYGITSDMIHGGWGEISQLHLAYYEGNFYRPQLEFYSDMEIKIMLSLNSIIIEAIKKYLEWNEIIIYDKDSLNELKRINNLMSSSILDSPL